MRYAILSDVHANRDALERVLADARACGAERIVCLGDSVGYGPLPAETLARLRAVASVVLAGNHDDAVSGRTDAESFIDLAGDAVRRHREALSHDALAYLASLPYTAEIEGARLAHGDLTAPTAFRYIDSEEAAAANFAVSDAPLLFVGHTHVPGLYLTGQSGRVYALGAEDFEVEDGKRYIVNVGSVGYPRETNGKCLSSYVLYDSADRSVRFRTLPFAVASVLQRGRADRRRRWLAPLLAVLIATAGLVGAVLVRNSRTPEPAESAPLEQRTVELPESARGLRANLELAPQSTAVQLTLVFTCGSNRCGYVSDTVKKKSAKRFPIPKGATGVLLTVRPTDASGARPVIQRFAPSVE